MGVYRGVRIHTEKARVAMEEEEVDGGGAGGLHYISTASKVPPLSSFS